MNKSKKLRKMLAAASMASLVATAAITPAQAGYDADDSRAYGSYDTNRTTTVRGGTTVRTTRTSPVYGTYYETRTAGNITVTGTLIEDADDKNFAIRDAWGRTFNVETSRFVGADAANKLQSGDLVRVYGEWTGDRLYATNLRTLGRTAVPLGTRVEYQTRYYTIGEMTNIRGTLVTDADDDEFELRADNGVTYMIRTRNVPAALNANGLQEGQVVNVYGYWISPADGQQPQLEASNLRVIR